MNRLTIDHSDATVTLPGQLEQQPIEAELYRVSAVFVCLVAPTLMHLCRLERRR